MSEPYVNVPLPFGEGEERASCAECQRVLPRVPYSSLNRPQKYCSMHCLRRGRQRLKRWQEIQGIPQSDPGRLRG